MRNFALRPAWILLVGAALFWGAAPISSLAARAQANSSEAEKKSSAPSPKKKPTKSSKKRPRRPRAQTAPTAARIKEIQGALAKAGYYQGEPTGKWDAPSVQAMKNFQQASELKPTGKFDALSLQKLGLGSQIAGAAAPRTTSNNSQSPQSPPL